MAIYGINDTIKQLNETTDYYSGYNITTTSFIGIDSNISSMASQYRKGTKYPDLSSIVQSSKTEKIESDRSKWTVVYKTLLSAGSAGIEEPEDDELTRTWSMTMAQYTFPLESYLSADEAYQVKSWEDSDYEHRKAFEYLYGVSEGSGELDYHTLTGKAMGVAKKKWAGKMEVIKFYPQLTRTSTFKERKKQVQRASLIGKIDTWSVLNEFSEYNVEWLKTQYDWSQNPDNTWTLVEAWLGAPKWDRDLYGPNAWEQVMV